MEFWSELNTDKQHFQREQQADVIKRFIPIYTTKVQFKYNDGGGRDQLQIMIKTVQNTSFNYICTNYVEIFTM